jgi:hypothetical protein
MREITHFHVMKCISIRKLETSPLFAIILRLRSEITTKVGFHAAKGL